LVRTSGVGVGRGRREREREREVDEGVDERKAAVGNNRENGEMGEWERMSV